MLCKLYKQNVKIVYGISKDEANIKRKIIHESLPKSSNQHHMTSNNSDVPVLLTTMFLRGVLLY